MMNLGRYIVEEIKKLSKNRVALISVMVALLVPLVYSAIILSAKWWPTDNLDNVPVAIVNNDEGADRDGEAINVGEQLIENLKDNDELGWHFVTAEEAEAGMENNEYFMLVEVPENFSENAITVLDDEPKRPELNYIQNEGLHYMGTTVTDTAIDSLKSQLSTQITETYVETMFAQLGDVADGFAEAHEGAEQIEDGAGQLKDGSHEILSALVDKAPDISRLAEGSQELNAGTGELLSNLQEKSSDISRLASGAQELNDGTNLLLSTLQEKAPDINRLNEGAAELSGGAQELHAGTEELSAGAATAKNGSEQLVGGLGQLAAGSIELADGVVQAQQGVYETIESMGQLQEVLTVLQSMDRTHPSFDGILNTALEELSVGLADAPQKQEDFQRLVDGANQLKSNLIEGSEFNAGLHELNNGLGDLHAGANQLRDGATQLAAGANEIGDGTNTVKDGWDELIYNVNLLNDGAMQVADGNRTVESGWQELTVGATQLHDGSTQIADGTVTVRSGWGELTDGVTQVDDGLGELLDGSTQLADGLHGGVEQTSELNPTDDNKLMFADPVLLEGASINPFPYYRDANAPYILTLALFVGVLALSFVVSYRKPAVMPRTAITWYTGKLTNLILLVTAQSLIVSLYSLLVLKLEVQSSLAFILFSIWVSLTFLMIILFLVALAGNVGRFIALAFVVMQMSTTGSALPVHMLPEGLRNMSTYLPFTHSINGFRSIITLGNTTTTWASVSALLVYFALFALLSLAVFLWKYRSLQVENVEVSEEAA